MINKSIAIIGLGGLGGFTAEYLGRENFKEILLVDGDKFSLSNINRQLLSNKETVGSYKTDNYKKHIEKYSDSKVVAVNKYLDISNINILDNVDIIVDSLDNIESRLLLEDYCSKTNKMLVHGSIGKDYGMVGLVPPNSKYISKLYIDKNNQKLPTNSCYVGGVAAFQSALLLKYLNNQIKDINDEFYYIDLEEFIIKKIKL